MSVSLNRIITEKVKQSGARWDVVERDYILGWILFGISTEPHLQKVAIFKGGTALKKCYFGDYRFSEDLDFTLTEPSNHLKHGLENACRIAEKAMHKFAPIFLSVEEYKEKNPHPKRQSAFVVRARFPWQHQAQTRVLVEMTEEESILFPIQKRPILHGYEDPVLGEINAYSLEEIISEKLRAILQSVEANKNRSWSRSRARDYYDIYRILSEYRGELQLSNFFDFVNDKCVSKGITFSGIEDIFEPSLIKQISETWKEWLEPLVPNLMPFEDVEIKLRPLLSDILRR